jgi:arabinose-5-phosphate isomerase
MNQADSHLDAPGSANARAQQAQFARQVLRAEADAVARIELDDSFHEAVELILKAIASAGEGGSAASVVVSGLGKSGLIGQKLSATFASTGTPSHFLHPTEAMHGDLGRVRRGDVVLLLSRGGNTDEVVTLATILRQDHVPVIAIVGKGTCDLARLATVTIPIGDVTEACPLNLAPTASTTAMLALGDALALTVSRARDFSVEDFQRVHPGGALGRLLMPITQAMRFRVGENVPLIRAGASVSDALHADPPNGRRAGALLVIDAGGRLTGILTDGDLRRLIRDGADFLRRPIDDVMTRNPRRLPDTALVRDAVQLVRELRIDEVPIVDGDGKPVGLIDVQDLMALKVIEG